MTREEKIKVLAELDGWTQIKDEVLGSGGGRTSSPYGVPPGKNYRAICKSYLTSYDAIIPLAKKCLEGQTFEPDKFYKAIPNYYPHILTFIQHTSAQELADALLKAVGKWRE